MVAIREFHDVISGRVPVDLPSDFKATRVEIIVLPIEESDKHAENAPGTLQALLLTAPTLTADELLEYERVQEWMTEWSVADF